MEHGGAAFIDSQNRANTFVNYVATREWKTLTGRGQKKKEEKLKEAEIWRGTDRIDQSAGEGMGE